MGGWHHPLVSKRELILQPQSWGATVKSGNRARAALEALSSSTARSRTLGRRASVQLQSPTPRASPFAFRLDRLLLTRNNPPACLSSRALPQESSRPTQHRPRPVDPVHDRTSRKLACYRNQPIDVVTRNKSACGNRKDLGAASGAPRLNLSDLESIQKHAIAPAPASKRSDSSTWFDPQSRPNSLLNSHTISPSSSLSCTRGARKYTKIL